MTRGMKYPPEPLTQAEVRALLGTCSRRAPTGIRDNALIVVLWRTGLRISEALALLPGDIDFERHEVRVRNGKGGRSRVVGIDDEALAHVQRWLDRRAVHGFGPKQALFCTLRGDQVSRAHVRMMLRRRRERAGIVKRVHAHGFRHTMAREMHDEGVPLQVIQAQLGHASLDGTAIYLNRIAPKQLVEVMQQRGQQREPAPDPAAMREQLVERLDDATVARLLEVLA